MATLDSQFEPVGERRERAVDELILVVHGVGDPQAGETLSLFARSIAESRHPLTEQQEILWLEDEADERPDRDVATFPCHTRYLSFAGSQSTLAEVYWADMSRVQRGLPGIVSGIISIVFGLRYVAFVASEQKGIAAKSLQALGLICSRMLHGPVLAVNFVLAMLIVTVAGTEALWPGSSLLGRWATFLVMGCVFLCLVSSFLGWRLTINRVCHRFWYWVMITSVFLNGLMLWNLMRHEAFALANYCNVMVVMLGFQWIALVGALLAMTVLWFCALFEKNNYKPALHIALLLPSLAVGIWGQMLPMIWIGGSTSLMNFLTPRENQAELILVDSEDGSRNSASASSSEKPAFIIRRPGKRPIPIGTRHDHDFDKSAPVREQLKQMFSSAVPLMGIQFIVSMLLGLTMIVQLGRYMRWSERTSVDEFKKGARAPRLIVNGLVQIMTLVSVTAVMILILAFSTQEFVGYNLEGSWVFETLIEANKYAAGFIFPIAGMVAISLHYMRPGLDIMLDVVNHFYFRSPTRHDRVQSMDEDYDIDEVTFNGGAYYFSRRDAIHRRMKRILNYYRDYLPGNPSLTIVSHSQGSLIAIEVLNDEELGWINDKFRRVNLITMGSPFHHIYQKYFSHFYPPLDHPDWERLRQRVRCWLNIFRIDDFVGTEIDFPESLPQAGNGFYTNHPVQRRGHMLYWSDRQVLKVIREHDICRSLTLQDGELRKAA